MELITTWSQHHCIKCKAIYAMPKMVEDEYQDSHQTFYCPYCKQPHYYPQETDEERFKRLYESEKRCCLNAQEEAESLYKSVVAYKGHLTRAKKKQA